MNLPIFGKPRFTRFVLAVFFLYFLLFHQTACLPPPLNLTCDFCFDGTCGVNTGFVCKDGYCVPESDPNPAQCKTTENTEGGIEQAEVPEEAGTPEESANPEEPTRPEREPLPEYQIETPEVPETTQPTITAIEGDGDKKEIVFPSGVQEPANAQKAALRFRTAWHIIGVHLSKIDSWQLQSQDKSKTFPLTILEKEDTNMKLALPTALTAGFFTLIGLIGTTPTVQAQIYVLQGEKGDKGDAGATGATGQNGKDGQGFDPATLTFVNALKSAVTVNGNTLTFKAETIIVETKTFKIEGTTKGASLQFDDDKQTITVNKANLQVTSGSGTTDGTVNGFGNIIIGYNENTSAKTRTGSHNLILGTEHGYTEYSSILSGTQHTINAPYASAIGGSSSTMTLNSAYAVAVAGQNNKIDSNYAAAVAGQNNSNTGTHAAAVAGQNNSNTGTHAAAVAGQNNSITASHAATLAGGGSMQGDENIVSKSYAAAVAGRKNKVEGECAAAVAGQDNTAGGNYAAAVAGQDNATQGTHSSALGGQHNQIGSTAHFSAIVGGGGKSGATSTKSGNTTTASHTAILGGQNNNLGASSKVGMAACGSFKAVGNLNAPSCCVVNP